MSIDVKNYFNNFQPHFYEDKFNELVNNPPTSLRTENGNIYVNKLFVKSILIACKMLWQEMDRNNLYSGPEGTGKSHAAFQHTYVWWWCLNELGMINYEFGMHLIYAKVSDLVKAFDDYKDIPYMIYTCDETDELDRKNWNKPIVKKCMSKLRKERKNLRIVNFIMPSADEMLPSITLTRINWIVLIDVEMDEEFNLIRGEYKIINIPIAKSFYNAFLGQYVSRNRIKRYLRNRLYNSDEKYSEYPKWLCAIRDRINKTFVFNKNTYLEWSRKKNAEKIEEDNNNKYMLQRDTLILFCTKNGISQQRIAAALGMSGSRVGVIKRDYEYKKTHGMLPNISPNE